MRRIKRLFSWLLFFSLLAPIWIFVSAPIGIILHLLIALFYPQVLTPFGLIATVATTAGIAFVVCLLLWVRAVTIYRDQHRRITAKFLQRSPMSDEEFLAEIGAQSVQPALFLRQLVAYQYEVDVELIRPDDDVVADQEAEGWRVDVYGRLLAPLIAVDGRQPSVQHLFDGPRDYSVRRLLDVVTKSLAETAAAKEQPESK